MADIAGTLRRGDGGQGGPDGRPQPLHRARGNGPQAGFEFGKDLLNRIEVRAVRGQVERPRPDGFQGRPHPGDFMTSQIVHDHRVVWLEGRGEDLLDIGHEARAIQRPVKDGGGGEVLGAEGRNDRGGLPMAVRDLRHHARPAPTPAIPAGQLGLHRRLVQEDEPLPVPLRCLCPPALPGRYHIRPCLFGRVQDFFLLSFPIAAPPATPW